MENLELLNAKMMHRGHNFQAQTTATNGNNSDTVRRRVFNSLNLPNFMSSYDNNSSQIQKYNDYNEIGRNKNDNLNQNKVNYFNHISTQNTIRAISNDSVKSLACCLRYNFSTYNSFKNEDSTSSLKSTVDLIKPVALRPKKSNTTALSNEEHLSVIYSNSNLNGILLSFNDKNRPSRFVDRRSLSNQKAHTTTAKIASITNSTLAQNISRPHLNLIKMKISNLNEISLSNNKKHVNSMSDEMNTLSSKTNNSKIMIQYSSSFNDESNTYSASSVSTDTTSTKSSSLTSISNYSRFNSSDIESIDLDQIEKDDLC